MFMACIFLTKQEKWHCTKTVCVLDGVYTWLQSSPFTPYLNVQHKILNHRMLSKSPRRMPKRIPDECRYASGPAWTEELRSMSHKVITQSRFNNWGMYFRCLKSGRFKISGKSFCSVLPEKSSVRFSLKSCHSESHWETGYLQPQ